MVTRAIGRRAASGTATLAASAFGETAFAVSSVAEASSRMARALVPRTAVLSTFHSGLLHTLGAPVILTDRCATSRAFCTLAGACDGISLDTRSSLRYEDGYGGAPLAALPQPYGS